MLTRRKKECRQIGVDSKVGFHPRGAKSTIEAFPRIVFENQVADQLVVGGGNSKLRCKGAPGRETVEVIKRNKHSPAKNHRGKKQAGRSSRRSRTQRSGRFTMELDPRVCFPIPP